MGRALGLLLFSRSARVDSGSSILYNLISIPTILISRKTVR